MKKHLSYLWYIVRHKWFVLVAGLKIGAPLWLLLVHDLSKLLPSEWFAYANYFYGGKKDQAAFDIAWLKHQHRNQHHWQAWCLIEDENWWPKPQPMPRKYILEMVADWMGAGRAITGRWAVVEWYEKNKDQILLHPNTRVEVERLLSVDRK